MYCCRRQKGEQRVRTAAGNRMKREWIGFLFLLLLSVRDIREKKVNIAFLLPGFVLAFYQMPDGFLRAEGTGFFVQYPFVCSFHSDKGSDRKGRCICGFAVCLLSALLSGVFYFCGRAFYGRYCRDLSYFGAEREQKDGNTVSAVSYVFLSDLFG